jgi:hypothetical protein
MRTDLLHLLPLLLFLPAVAALAVELPDPYRRTSESTLGPSSVPVMEQVFWLELACPPETQVEVSAPEGVRLLDRTKPGKGRTRTRLYFRSDRGIENGAFTVIVGGGQPTEVPLRVLTYRQDVERWITEVPGVDPAARKRGRSYYTDEMLAQAKRNLEKYPKLRESLEGATVYDSMADERIFQSLPSWSVPRQCYSNWPCPKCGETIYKVSAFYPWQLGGVPLLKAQCPECKQVFPTNDFAHDDFTSGDYPDDGWGWDPGTGRREDFAGWVAYYNHQSLWQGFPGQLTRLSQRALLLGDKEAAHKVGVVLARMAYVYPGMNTRRQQVRTGYLRPGRLLIDGNWERNTVLVPVARAYDAVFELLDADTGLVEFLQTKDPSIKSPADVKALIDTYLIQVFGWDWMRRELSGGNMGAREEDMAQFAVCADMGPVSDHWIEELFTHAYNSGANMGGFDDETFINTTTREGPVWISALGYAYDYLRSKSDMAEILARVNSPEWKARCDLYDPTRYPKFRAEFDTWMDFVVAGRFGPSYGDSGGGGTAEYPNGIPAQLRPEYESAYRHWPTDRIAGAIYRLGPRDPGLFEDDLWPQIEAQAKKAGPEPPLGSRVMDGVGFAFLESRAQAEEPKERAGIALRYGYGHGHHHQDNLNIEMFAKGLSVAPELGYPCWAHPMGNTSHVAHHNTGMIDRSPQYKSAISRGDLELFAAAPEASFVEVSAAPDGFPNRVYRRVVCLADAPNGNVYLMDLLSLAGGTVRTCCFHGPGHDDFQTNLTFGAKAETLDVGEVGRGLANNIVEPQVASSDGEVWGDWKCKGKDVRVRLTYLGEPGRRYITARCAKPDIPPIRYLFAEEEAPDGASQFVSIWQPYEGAPFIEKVERLTIPSRDGDGGPPGGDFVPVAVRVSLAGGQVDTFIYASDPGTTLRVGDLEFKGSFGYWSELNGKPRAAHLVNGAYLRKGDVGIADMPPPFRAHVTAADLASSTLTLDAELPKGQDWTGQLLFVRGGDHRTAYHIAEVTPPGNVVKLDLNSIVFRSKLMGIAEDKSHLVTEISPPVEASRGFKPGYYNGAVLTGEDLKARCRVTKVEGDRVFLDREVNEADFPDADGDGRRMVSIYDFGEGDEVTLFRSAYRRFD